MSNSGNNPEEPNAGKRSAEQSPRSQPGRLPTPKMKRGPKVFFNEVSREAKKVNWPTRQETNRLTGVVLTVCLLVGGILSGLSFLFGLIIDMITKGRV